MKVKLYTEELHMALKAIKCTQCGADLQLNDQKEFK